MSIVFEGIWKQFRRGELHDSLRDLLPALARGLFGRQTELGADQAFWALKDLSFQVGPGQALGIIGPNGAGKSTTLKILTRVLEPTRGRYRVDGRIGALLEIGGAFHPDLTGRENIFLQGTIMGMRHREIRARFDQIVDFSGVGEFIDTPVKRYSSGMDARLGFAIAAHLEVDALIIDEVLAVGDYAYQQKAFERIGSLVASGIPVVLVSHQLDRVASLCTHALLLDRGALRKAGTPEECIAEYVKAEESGLRPLKDQALLPLELTRMGITPEGPIPCGGNVTIRLEGNLTGQLPAELDPLAFRLVSAQNGREVFATSAHECGVAPPSEPGPFAVELTLQLNARPGVYLLESVVMDWTRWNYVARGPLSYLHVVPGQPFRGQVQMNARMSRVATRSGAPSGER